uniref:Uncharacterized protein n=1 Tax=Manihot esculenta TaxID=3983 RepID=A0A2C9WKM1_MANES
MDLPPNNCSIFVQDCCNLRNCRLKITKKRRKKKPFSLYR